MIFAVVIVAMGYSLWKFRQRGPSDLRDGDPTHGNTLLEIVWTAIPLVIVAVFGIWGAIVLDDNEAHAKRRPRDHGRSATASTSSTATTATAASRATTASTCPVGETITLHMITPLYTPGTKNARGHPQLLGAGVGGQAGRDPGRERQDRRHDLRHAHARRDVRGAVHRAVRLGPRHDELQEHPRATRRSASRSGSPAPRRRRPRRSRGRQANPGLAVFNASGCGGCHTFTPAKSSGTAGPSLDDLNASFDEAKAAGKTKATDLAGFIKESIVDPNVYVAKGFAPGIMPQDFGSDLSPKQIDDLVAYLAKGGSG